MQSRHALIAIQSLDRCVVGAHESFDSLVSHGIQFCLREPLNTTQSFSEAL